MIPCIDMCHITNLMSWLEIDLNFGEEKINVWLKRKFRLQICFNGNAFKRMCFKLMRMRFIYSEPRELLECFWNFNATIAMFLIMYHTSSDSDVCVCILYVCGYVCFSPQTYFFALSSSTSASSSSSCSSFH